MEHKGKLHPPRLWRFLILFGVVGVSMVEGVDGRGNEGWAQGHATFYGADQSPSTLGEFTDTLRTSALK